MLSRTHLTVGTAASLAASFFILRPESLSDVLIAFAGGAVGGVFADVDTVSHDRKHDAFISQALAALDRALLLVERNVNQKILFTDLVNRLYMTVL